MLFDLKADLSETRDLSTQRPEQVQQLDGLIEQFLKRTNAVTPKVNPAFDAAKYRPELEGKASREGKAREGKKSEPQPGSGGDRNDLALKGWKARNCTATVSHGLLQLRE